MIAPLVTLAWDGGYLEDATGGLELTIKKSLNPLCIFLSGVVSVPFSSPLAAVPASAQKVTEMLDGAHLPGALFHLI